MDLEPEAPEDFAEAASQQILIEAGNAQEWEGVFDTLDTRISRAIRKVHCFIGRNGWKVS